MVKFVRFPFLCFICFLVFATSVFAATNASQTASVGTVTTVTNSTGAFTAIGGSSNDFTPGSIYSINLSVATPTRRWAGIFGNISGGLTLKDSSSNVFYNFGSTNGSMVFLTELNTAVTWSNIRAAVPANVDLVWGYGTSDIDSATASFLTTDVIGGITGVSSAKLNSNTASAGSPWNVGIFEANATRIADSNPGGKTNYIFGVNVNSTGAYYASSTTADYQIMVPVSTNSETYYFYVEIP